MDNDKLQREPDKRKRMKVRRRVLKPGGTRYTEEELDLRGWGSRFRAHLREQFEAGVGLEEAMKLAAESFTTEITRLKAVSPKFDDTTPRTLLPTIMDASREDWNRWRSI